MGKSKKKKHFFSVSLCLSFFSPLAHTFSIISSVANPEHCVIVLIPLALHCKNWLLVAVVVVDLVHAFR